MQRFDVIVVGGGIHGAGVAQAAAAAGHSVLLLEKAGLAAGTSSRSSKLIHGGLRYLETGQLRLVRESLQERRRLLANAPDLVELRPFFIPVYPATSRRPWQLRAGLCLYAVLAGFAPGARFASVPRRQWSELDGLDTDGLQCVLRYHDAQTDDALLTRAVMASARSLGAELACPARFLGATVQGDAVAVRYSTPAATHEAAAAVLVNAAGPWAHRVARLVEPRRAAPAMSLVQGTHVLLPERLSQGVYYLESPADRRAVFMMPRGAHTLVGTTEVEFDGDPDHVVPARAEVDYLLAVVARYFPRYRGFDPADVLETWAGLRVLPAGREAAFRRSRETIYDLDDAARPRVVTIYGGKLTAYRATAAHVMAQLAASLPARTPRADTAQLPLSPP